MTSTALPSSDRKFMVANAVVSALALSLLAYLLVLPRDVQGGDALSFMPAVNACLNGAAAVLLVLGRSAIKRGDRARHKRMMVSAFAASSLFLVGYLAYHYVHGDTKFMGTGAIRYAYFSVLISHVLLSIAIVPMALASFYYAFQGRFSTHAKVTRILHPIWLYVSVTGVVIFLMLRYGA
jgi:putative membrane protein